MPLANPGLPLPPDRRQLPASRVSSVRTALARFRTAAKSRPLPRIAPPPPLLGPQKSQPIPGQIYKPPAKGKVWTANPREILSLIARFARERKIIIIRYRAKKHGGKVVTRAVSPYALRYKTGANGRSRYLYAEDSGQGNPTPGIHSFLVPNIISVQGTESTFTPKWQIEF